MEASQRVISAPQGTISERPALNVAALDAATDETRDRRPGQE
jgi:hypothetical protein